MNPPKYLAVKFHHQSVIQEVVDSIVKSCETEDFKLKAYCTSDNNRHGFSDFVGTTKLCAVVDRKLKEIYADSKIVSINNYFIFEFECLIMINEVMDVVSKAMTFEIDGKEYSVGGLTYPINISRVDDVLLYEYELYM